MGCKGIRLKSKAATPGHVGQRTGSARKRRAAADKLIELQLAAAKAGMTPIKVRQQGQLEVDAIRAEQPQYLRRFMQNNPGFSYSRYY